MIVFLKGKEGIKGTKRVGETPGIGSRPYREEADSRMDKEDAGITESTSTGTSRTESIFFGFLAFRYQILQLLFYCKTVLVFSFAVSNMGGLLKGCLFCRILLPQKNLSTAHILRALGLNRCRGVAQDLQLLMLKTLIESLKLRMKKLTLS